MTANSHPLETKLLEQNQRNLMDKTCVGAIASQASGIPGPVFEREFDPVAVDQFMDVLARMMAKRHLRLLQEHQRPETAAVANTYASPNIRA